MKQKSIYTVKQCTAQAFRAMPTTFGSIQLVQMARTLLARPSCSDGNILRRLRELRAEHPAQFGYKVIDADRSIYRKNQ